jgi:hypothetical protein
MANQDQEFISGTYSFLDVLASMTGPGGSFDIRGMGVAAEGIRISYSSDKDTMTIGAGGAGQHSLRAGQEATVTISLLKTAPGNALMNQIYNYQKQSAAYWGQNQLTINNPVSGDKVSCYNGAFSKAPDLIYDTAGPVQVWAFHFVQVEETLGNGYQNSALIAHA